MARKPLSRTFRKQLADALIARVKLMDLPNHSAEARELGLSRARWAGLRAGELDLISLDKLIDAADRIGLVVRLSVTRPYGS